MELIFPGWFETDVGSLHLLCLWLLDILVSLSLCTHDLVIDVANHLLRSLGAKTKTKENEWSTVELLLLIQPRIELSFAVAVPKLAAAQNEKLLGAQSPHPQQSLAAAFQYHLLGQKRQG